MSKQACKLEKKDLEKLQNQHPSLHTDENIEKYAKRHKCHRQNNVFGVDTYILYTGVRRHENGII